MKKKTYSQLFPNSDYPVLITSEQNIFYTIGFSTTARRPAQIGINCVLMTPRKTCFYFPANWLPQVSRQVDDNSVQLKPYRGDIENLAEMITEQLKDQAMLGYERDGMELNFYLAVKDKVQQHQKELRWVNCSDTFKKLRMIKDHDEIDALRASANLAKVSMEYAKTIIKPGKRELDVVAELEYYMRRHGSTGVPFTMKVLAGENAVQTINVPGDQVIHAGDVVLLDFGATVQNYASDWTRSFAVGYAGTAQQELYNLVWKIERECIKMIRPGVVYQELMERAMEVIHGHPYARWFNPYLGHSIGITSQEWPPIIPGSEVVLKENMVITIEPGVYIPGIGGVRIEDEILVTGEGYEVLTGLQEEGFVLEGK